MMKWLSVFLILAVLVAGCSSTSEPPEAKLESFKQAHKAIYDAWQATTELDLKDRLSRGLADPLLSEQMQQQKAVMMQRLQQNERHGVTNLAFNKLEMVEDGSDDFTVFADWTVEGYREHGDVHEMKVSYKKKFHVIKQEGMWKLDKMFD
jgi:hypothetical protein